MVAVKHTMTHNATREQARQAIQTALQVYCRKFPEYRPHTSWVTKYRAETTFHVRRMTLVAKIEILKDHFDMGMNVPLLFYPFRKRAQVVLEKEIRKWLARAKAGELRKVPER